LCAKKFDTGLDTPAQFPWKLALFAG